jgi:hypothetical protein
MFTVGAVLRAANALPHLEHNTGWRDILLQIDKILIDLGQRLVRWIVDLIKGKEVTTLGVVLFNELCQVPLHVAPVDEEGEQHLVDFFDLRYLFSSLLFVIANSGRGENEDGLRLALCSTDLSQSQADYFVRTNVGQYETVWLEVPESPHIFALLSRSTQVFLSCHGKYATAQPTPPHVSG